MGFAGCDLNRSYIYYISLRWPNSDPSCLEIVPRACQVWCILALDVVRCGNLFFLFEKLDVGTFVSLCLILRQGLQRLRNQRAELKGSRRRCHCVNTRIHPRQPWLTRRWLLRCTGRRTQAVVAVAPTTTPWARPPDH